MNRAELNSIFNTHIKDHLSPKGWERQDVSGKYDDLCSFLGGNCFQSGSWARFTSTTPVNDLDVIWVIPKEFITRSIIQKSNGTIDPNHVDPSGILSNLAAHLREAYRKAGKQVRIVAQSHSVGVYFGTDDEFSIDVVPAIVSGEKNIFGDDIYWVPQIAALSKSRRAEVYSKHEAIDWIKSDPRGYIEDARLLNDSNENFRKVAKFARKWRKESKKQDDSFPLKSFHLELIVNDIFCEVEGIDTIGGIKEFFAKLPHYINTPSFVDRADASRHVDSYVSSLTDADRAKIIARLNAVNATLASVEMASTNSVVMSLIKNILSSATPPAGSMVVVKAPRVIALGDHSHKASLTDVGIIDQPTYPCKVSVSAQLYFKGPKDKKVNRRPKGIIKSNGLIPTWHEIDYTAKTDAPVPYDVYWQVVNTGEHARQEGGLRGQIVRGSLTQTERSLYTGKHWIECFIVTKEGVCIARSGPFFVMFRNPEFPLALP